MAAGLGFKDFTTGEVLTAADVDGYLMQGIWVFASAAARDAAVTSPQEGNACYLKDTNQVLTYSGSAWVAVGGGSPLTTKGDVYGFSTVDARIPIGANDTVLTADSTQALGLKWAAPAGGGKVLQVVQATSTTYTAAGNTNYIDTGLSLTITPTLATSKIMIACYPVMNTYNAAGVADMNTKARIVRNVPSANTVVQEITPGYFTLATGSSTPDRSVAAIVPVVYLDAPATTSAITYKLQFGQATTTRTGSYLFFNADNQTSVVIAMEIGA